ncbi:MAG: hypothetical protein IBX72_14005 [Nitrospirae bacterium]|jgi:hypothetical protein|nr:hypothetical protein [Nitrospirota bacterium]
MPYVRPGRRLELDSIVSHMAEHLKLDGDLNYVLFGYCRRHVKPSYNNYKNFIGELNEAVAEIRRRMLAPYEDEKIKENGDVY